MEISDKEVREYEEKFKSVLFSRIVELSSKNAEIIITMKKNGKDSNENYHLHNIGIALNNKLSEIQHIFNKSGISIYAEKIEEYNFVTSSFVGEAIIYDLIDCAAEGIKQLAAYVETIKEIESEKTQALQRMNPIRKFFVRFKSMFVPVTDENLLYTQEEKEQISSYLVNYENANKKMWNYNLRDNIVSSITKKIREDDYKACNIPSVIQECVKPVLQKLDLDDLIPELEKNLEKEYRKDVPDLSIYKIDEDQINLYIPNFNKDKSGKGEFKEENIKKDQLPEEEEL